MTRFHAGLVCLGALGVFALSGCAAAPTSLETRSAAQELVARERVADLARDIGAERPSDIDGWARAAVAAAGPPSLAGGIELIGIEARQSTELSEPFGRLTFRVPVPEQENAAAGVAGAYCFDVEFDYYGKVGTWETSDGVSPIECPPDAAVIRPPADERIVARVSPNAREVAAAVLLQRARTGEPATVSAIIEAISAQLDAPTGAFEVVAPPRVVLEADTAGDRIGVAFGASDECVLVKSENGSVEDVRPAPILLQPGELGCNPETALMDPDQLRPPH